MKKRYLLFILLLILPVFISAETLSLAPDPNQIYYDYFYKMDEENNIISDAEFVLRNFDGNVKYDVTYDEDTRAYKYPVHFYDDNKKLINFIPSNIKDIVSNFRKMEDFTPYINYAVLERSTVKDFENMYVRCKKYNADDYGEAAAEAPVSNKYKVKKLVSEQKYQECFIIIPTVMFIEETKTPKGLEKETFVLPITISLNYEFNQETEEVTSVTSNVTMKQIAYILDENNNESALIGPYKYDNTLDYNNIENVYNTFANYDETMMYNFTEACAWKDGSAVMVTPIIPKLQKGNIDNYHVEKLATTNNNFELKCGTPIIVDKKGSSALSVNSYVNSKEEVNITENSNVEIKVFLKNSGKAPSYENKVVSNVPEGVEYVAGSATDNGVYDEEKNTVTWDLDYLDASSGYIFSYEVAVTTGSKESVYVTTSSVSSDDNETPIVSNEAKVTTPGVGGDAPEEESEEIVNPKTGDERSMILVVILIISLSVLYYFNTKKQFEL